jgi:hypothetical protein
VVCTGTAAIWSPPGARTPGTSLIADLQTDSVLAFRFVDYPGTDTVRMPISKIITQKSFV